MLGNLYCSDVLGDLQFWGGGVVGWQTWSYLAKCVSPSFIGFFSAPKTEDMVFSAHENWHF